MLSKFNWRIIIILKVLPPFNMYYKLKKNIINTCPLILHTHRLQAEPNRRSMLQNLKLIPHFQRFSLLVHTNIFYVKRWMGRTPSDYKQLLLPLDNYKEILVLCCRPQKAYISPFLRKPMSWTYGNSITGNPGVRNKIYIYI